MTDLRDARAAVIRRHYRLLADSLTEALPGLLDDLDAVDVATLGHCLDPAAEIRRLHAECDRLRAELEVAHGGADPGEQPQPPAKAARGARKPRGDTAT